MKIMTIFEGRHASMADDPIKLFLTRFSFLGVDDHGQHEPGQRSGGLRIIRWQVKGTGPCLRSSITHSFGPCGAEGCLRQYGVSFACKKRLHTTSKQPAMQLPCRSRDYSSVLESATHRNSNVRCLGSAPHSWRSIAQNGRRKGQKTLRFGAQLRRTCPRKLRIIFEPFLCFSFPFCYRRWNILHPCEEVDKVMSWGCIIKNDVRKLVYVRDGGFMSRGNRWEIVWDR